MRKLIYIGVLLVAFGCTPKSQPAPDRTIQLRDSITVLKSQVRFFSDSIKVLLERPAMSELQFIKIYKYERLEKYYRICVSNPTQWVYYKGWSIRVFTQ